jgi:hypothetical protein
VLASIAIPVLRTLDEEKMLQDELEGYDADARGGTLSAGARTLVRRPAEEGYYCLAVSLCTAAD